MEILLAILIVVIIILLVCTMLIVNKGVAPVLILVWIILFIISRCITSNINKGEPASLNILTIGEKYEVVAMYERYIVTKSLADEKKIRFIGPLNFDTTPVGVGDVCIKTTEGSLEKFLRH